MKIHRLQAASFTALVTAAMLAHAGSSTASEPAQKPGQGIVESLPAPPAGFQNGAAVMAAIALGQVQLVKPPANLPDTIEEQKNLEYARAGEHSLRLDLFRPKAAARPAPALVFIHGGSWSGGNRDQLRPYAIHFAARGYVTATISYRLSGQAPFPAAVEDARSAIRWLRSNAPKFDIDPAKIAVVGHSAGGHLAMMIGYDPRGAAQGGIAGSDNSSSDVQAVVNFYGPFDLTVSFARENRQVRKFLQNKTYEQNPDLYLKASPSHYLKAGAPPTLIIHGTIDDVVPVSQSDALAARLKELNVPHAYDRLEGWPHALDAAKPMHERSIKLMERFFDIHLPLPAAGEQKRD